MNVVIDMQSRRAPGDTLRPPLVLGIGGTLRPRSTSEQALRIALQGAERQGARTEIITAQDLNLPMYEFGCGTLESAARLIEAARRADGLILSTPAYHGGPSGLLKNALDYLQELADDPSPYLHDKAVGCIVSAAGPQAGATTLVSIRSVIHALRGWPTPLGVCINSANQPFAPDGTVLDTKVGDRLRVLGGQVATFAQARQLSCAG